MTTPAHEEMLAKFGYVPALPKRVPTSECCKCKKPFEERSMLSRMIIGLVPMFFCNKCAMEYDQDMSL